ncbi:MAG: DUF120 domain-containing protein [Methanobacteriota archaeon]|nr:MAG: DUF120 domain-containing protein [Euryarchaeota archaeon]
MMRISAKVSEGLGKGGHFISIPIYEAIFERLLGKKPFHGTLNLVADSDDVVHVNSAYQQHGKLHDGLEWNGNEMGAIETLPAKLWIGENCLDVVLVRPALTRHHRSVIEVVSDRYLREEFGLEEGAIVDLEVPE